MYYLLKHLIKYVSLYFSAITLTEAIIWAKFGLELVARTQIINILIWLLIQVKFL